MLAIVPFPISDLRDFSPARRVSMGQVCPRRKLNGSAGQNADHPSLFCAFGQLFRPRSGSVSLTAPARDFIWKFCNL